MNGQHFVFIGAFPIFAYMNTTVIDLSDFCTGTPLFDLGIIMLQTSWLPEETERELYHIGRIRPPVHKMIGL